MAEQRIEIGFEGGTILRLTVEESAVEALVGGLNGDGEDWRSVDAEEGRHWLNTGEFVYIRIVPGGPPKVGFGGD